MKRTTISHLLVNTCTDMTDDWDLLGFVISSKYRKIVVDELSDRPATPSQISERGDVSIASVSHALSQLQDNDCVELLVNEDRRKGRVYGLTETGEDVWEEVQEQQLS